MLSEAQLAARKGKLTGSRVRALMVGDAEAVLRLYREMIGDEVEEDLSSVWPVQLGRVTEQLNLDWYERKNNLLSSRGEVVVHPLYDWAAATLDAWDTVLNCPVEAKHVGGREPLEVVIDRYQPQMQWQMECASASECALSVIMGAAEPVIEYIKHDDAYCAEMVRRGQQFIDCVRARTPPLVLEPVPPPANASKVYEFNDDNVWTNSALEWLETKPFSDRCKEAEKTLKAKVPEDAIKAFGRGVRITRDRAGRLSLREDR